MYVSTLEQCAILLYNERMKLIILNGTSGAGKTAVAKKLHAHIPLSVLVPNFEIRRMISGFKNNREKSREIMFNLMQGLVEKALFSGSDVIIDSKIHDECSGNSVIDKMAAKAREFGAETYEIILNLDKAAAMERIRNRGFSKDAILNEENLEENVDTFLKKMKEYTASRTNATIIDTSHLTEQEVFTKVKEVVGVL
jgi:broad-specificity NMP kinase